MRRLVTLIVMAGMVTSCGGSGSGTNPGRRLSVVASVYPLGWLAERIAPDAELEQLSVGGLEAHDLELTPRQRGALQRASAVLYVGPIGYQPQVEAAVASSGARSVALSDVAGPGRLLGPDGMPASDPQGKSGGDTAVDAHLWFSTEVMANMARQVSEAFASVDPTKAGLYRANAAAVRQELLDLGGQLEENLGGACRFQEVIVSHQAYGYLLAPHGVRQLGVSGINPEAGATSARLATLVDEIEAEGIEYVLGEPVEGRDGAESVAREAGVKLLDVLPLDAVTEDQAAIGFVELVRKQAATFATALGCRGA